MREVIIFYVNGERNEIKGNDAFLMLAEWLRKKRLLTGTKVVCAEGDCGACTVMLGIPIASGQLKYEPRNSCILPLFNLDGKHVVTVEGLKKNNELNPIQLSVARHGGAQCGYCTPGIVMAITAIFEQHARPTEEQFRSGLTGNLCRCTGYDGILRAALAIDAGQVNKLDYYWNIPAMKSELAKISLDPLAIKNDNTFIYMPTSWENLLQTKADHNQAVMVAGATDIGVSLNKGYSQNRKFISLARIPNIDTIGINDDVVEVCANVSLSQFETFCVQHIPSIGKFMKFFAAAQIKNSATLVGNIANASPSSDTLPFLSVLDADIEIVGINGNRRLNINHYFLDYKKTALKADEIISKVSFAKPKSDAHLILYKVSRRMYMNIATVSAAFLVEKQKNMITNFKVAFGGVAAFVKRLPAVEKFMQGKEFSIANIEHATKCALQTYTPLSDVRGSKQYREMLITNLFKKLYIEMEANG
ncbi:MAG: FAD binding domain-containing protein [Oligoflexia bacterium]|nr:FAD binding domain-containing protein [Oligoflexia bacterium]